MLGYNEMLEIAARYISISDSEYVRLQHPMANINVNLTLKLKSGETLNVPTYLTIMNDVGAGKGGLRIDRTVTREEVQSLAGLMEIKNRITELPFSGAKGGICIDADKLTHEDYENLIFLWAETYKAILIPHHKKYYYITACDVNTRPWMMSKIARYIGDYQCATSKDPLDGGIKGRPPATGFGVANITKYYLEKIEKKSLGETTIAIQGFGNVGSWTAHYLHLWGGKVVAVTDRFGGTFDERGIDIPALIRYTETSKNRSVAGFGEPYSNEEILFNPVDVLIPAALEDQITAENADRVQCRTLVSAANGPVTVEAEKILSEKGIVIIPGIANAGGVIASNYELLNVGDPAVVTVDDVQDYIVKKQITNFEEIVRLSEKMRVSLFIAEIVLAIRRRLDIFRTVGY